MGLPISHDSFEKPTEGGEITICGPGHPSKLGVHPEKQDVCDTNCGKSRALGGP